MGYESRVIIARKYSAKQDSCIDIVAELNLCKMDGDFLDLFDKEWKTGYYETSAEKTIVTDKYDKVVTYAPFNKVYKWCLDNANGKDGHRYRRLDVLIGVLNAVRLGWHDYKDFVIIHYGY